MEKRDILMKAVTSGLAEQPYSHRQYLALSVPLIISGLSTPLLGAVDTAVMGQLPNPAYIGGVAIGSLIFNYLYWLLGFLRFSTSGFTAQAQGANNQTEVIMSLLRPMGLAVIFGALFIVLQIPIKQIAFIFLEPSTAVENHAIQYFDVRIWGAPLTLLNYVILGWLIGMSKVRLSLFIQLFMNLMNILLDLIFVKIFLMGTVGVAAASLIAECSALVIGLTFLAWNKQIKGFPWNWSLFLHKASITKMLKINGDHFIRTLFLLTVFGLFTAKGTSMGEEILAANAILMQIQFIMAYILGGFANASSILVGRAIGERNNKLFNHTIKLTAIWSGSVSLLLALVLYVAGDEMITWFTAILEVQQASSEYLPWLIIFPLVGFWGLQLNGIFTGATAAKQIRNSMILSFIIFQLAVWLFVPLWKNHGLWFAFILFTFARSFFLGRYLPELSRTLQLKKERKGHIA